MTGSYRRFIKGYGILPKPLTKLLKKNKFDWNSASTTAFDKLKDVMITKTVLVLVDFEAEFMVEIDACEERVGVVLMQKANPIAYISKSLSEKCRSLSVYEKEMLAIVLALQK